MITIRKFKDHPSAQALIHEADNGDKALVSYTTTVAYMVDGWLFVDGLYSATTRKHLGWFMKELGLSYQIAKFIYEDWVAYNTRTGEIRPR